MVTSIMGTLHDSAVGTDSNVLSVNMLKTSFMILCRLKLFWIIYRMAASNVPNVDDNLDLIFESFVDAVLNTPSSLY